jgi:Chaperone of endosialidase
VAPGFDLDKSVGIFSNSMPMKIKFLAILITIAFGFIASLPTAGAVNPPPDGGYPNFTTAEGQKALFSLTTGVANTAVGWYSLFSNTSGNFNTASGAGALLFNSGDPTGSGAASENTAFGAAALLFNTTGAQNTGVGVAALLHNTNGSANTAIGEDALSSNTEGDANTASGFFALLTNTTGSNNTAHGVDALVNNSTGNSNTGVGFEVLDANDTGNDNTAVGTVALSHNTSGSENIALGVSAGDQVTTASNVICIGAVGQNVSNSCYIGSIFGQTSAGGAGVFINSDGKLGTMTSSRRFKEQIMPMEEASEALFALKPVTFHYKKEIASAGTSQFGLVAEEVEKVNPDLVVRDKEGKPYSVRYEAVNAMLLNEFLKEHRKVQELEKGMAALTAKLEEQAAQIQKISAQVANSAAQEANSVAQVAASSH